MSAPLFKSEFPDVSSKEWMDKIVQDLKGKPYDDLSWEIDDSTIVDPFYTIQRSSPLDETIHDKILHQLKASSWNIIQDLSKQSKEEIKKAWASDVSIIQLNEEDVLENRSDIQCSIYTKNKLKDIGSNYKLVSLLCDPITAWISGKTSDLTLDLITDEKIRLAASSIPFHNAGANDFDEVALLLAELNEYLHFLNESNIKSKELIIEVSAGINFYSSIAKIRAIRILFDQLLHHYPKLFISYTLQVSTSSYYNSHIDEHTNLLRHSTMALSAAIAGADGIKVFPFSAPNALSLRMARNIQHLLKEESYMDKVADMMAGSYFMEELTRIFMDKIWNSFRQIEDDGGLIAGLKIGKIKEKLAAQHEERVQKYIENEQTMIGVNKYASAESQNSHQEDPIDDRAWILPSLTLSKYL